MNTHRVTNYRRQNVIVFIKSKKANVQCPISNV